MTRGAWRMLAMLALLAFFLFLSVDAQDTPCKKAGGADCDSHATCFTSERGSFCSCNGFYNGDGFTCKYSAWRVVVYVLSSILMFALILYLCLSCMGYKRNRTQQSSYPMQPMGHHAYSYPPPATVQQSSANPAMYSYPPQTGYTPHPGYPVTTFPQYVVNPPRSKVPGPSGTT